MVHEYARDVDLLITEATLGNGFEQFAMENKHMTTDQVSRLIAKAKPWRSIVTHFSIRNR